MKRRSQKLAVDDSRSKSNVSGIRVVKIKRIRDKDADGAFRTQRTRRRRIESEMEPEYPSGAVNCAEVTQRRKTHLRAVSKKLCWPERLKEVRERWRKQNRLTHGPRSRPLSKKQIAEVDKKIYERVKKFLPFRESLFESKDERDYWVAVFHQQHPLPDFPPTVHEELIDTYKASTDDKERKALRKSFGVIRAMVKIEEGIVYEDDTTSEESNQEDEDAYDYYLEDDADIDEYLDKDGNLKQEVPLRVYDPVHQSETVVYYNPNEASDDSDSVKALWIG